MTKQMNTQVTPPATQIEAVEEMERLVGAGDWKAAAAYFTSDVKYRVGSREPTRGLDGIRSYMEWQNRLVRWDGHTMQSKWNDNDIVVIEVNSHFVRLSDGQPITVPCTDIYRMDGFKIREWQVYADISPFWTSPPVPSDGWTD